MAPWDMSKISLWMTSWALRYMVVDTRNWWPGKHVLVSPQWIESVRWSQSSVVVDLLRRRSRRAGGRPITLLNRAYGPGSTRISSACVLEETFDV